MAVNNKVLYRLFLLSSFYSLCSFYTPIVQHTKSQPTKYLMRARKVGLGSCLHSVLNELAFCEQNNYIPVMNWGQESLYYKTGGFNGSTSVWEYYFKPLSNVICKQNDKVIIKTAPNKFHIKMKQPSLEKRARAHALIQEYIHPNDIVQKKIDNFYANHIAGRHTIAIHVRGTDKIREVNSINPDNAVAEALKHAGPDTQFFIASDEKRIFDQLQKKLRGRKVIYYDCYRSVDGKPLHQGKNKLSVTKLGQDVVVEMYLMSMCDMIVHSVYSNVSNFALYLNPTIEHVAVYK